MEKPEIITTEKNEKLLRQKSQTLSDQEILSLKIQNLIETMITFSQTYKEGEFIAAGLAAIQLGQPYRIFLSDITEPEEEEEEETEKYVLQKKEGEDKDDESRRFEIFINPEIEILDYTQSTELESCISVPGRRAKVPRYNKIRIKYSDRNAVKQTKKFEGFDARVIQHEFDHLEGILFIDKMIE